MAAQSIVQRFNDAEAKRLSGQYSAAILDYHAIKKDVKDDSIYCPHVLLGLAEAYRMRDEFEAAEQWYNEAKQAYQICGYDKGVAASMLGNGRLSAQLVDYARATPMIQSAIELFDRVNDQAGTADGYLELGKISALSDNYELAMMYYDNAFNAYESINDVSGIAGVKCCLGQLQALQQNYDRAEDEYKMAMTLYKNTNDVVGKATVFSELGKLYQCMEQPLKAANFFMNAVKLYNSIG